MCCYGDQGYFDYRRAKEREREGERERERRAEEGEVGEDPGERRKRRGSAILIGLFINMYHLLQEEPHVSHDTTCVFTRVYH